MKARGITAHMRAVMMRDLMGVTLTMDIPQAGEVDIVSMMRTGIQGGAATPEIFKTIIEAIIETVIQTWLVLGFGILLNEGSALTHLVWADNIWLSATNRQDMAIMTQQLTGAVEEAGFKWKPTSLEYLHTVETAEKNQS